MQNSSKAGLVTALFAFGVTALTAVTGWLNSLTANVQEAVDSGAGTVEIPPVSSATQIIVSGVVALGAGLANTAFRYAQERGWLPSGSPPVYDVEVIDDDEQEVLDAFHAGEIVDEEPVEDGGLQPVS